MDRENPSEAMHEPQWRRTACAFLAAFAGMLVLFVLIVIVIDPYDSGRFPTFMPAGSPDERQPTINLGRGTDPRFNAILLGSSRGVLVDPRRLSASTGYRFVEMAAMGATVREQMAFLHWFARHRANVDAIVIATDQVWCSRDPALPGMADFPAGLYGDSTFAYFKATLSASTATFAKDRLLYALGLKSEVDRAGYYDSETKISWRGVDLPPPRWRVATKLPGRHLPALKLLDSSLREMRGSPPIVFWMPPYYRDALPPPDTQEGWELMACKETLRDWTGRRGHATFLDLATDTSESTDPRNFLDRDHVSKRYMRLIESRIADALNDLK